MTKKLVPPPRVLRASTQHLSCKLTDEEQRERGRKLASVLGDIKAEESRADMLKSQMKSAMSALEAQRDTLMLQVSRGAEVREVSTEDIAHYDTETVTTVRTDTGEVIDTRTMEPAERQYELGQETEPEGAAV